MEEHTTENLEKKKGEEGDKKNKSPRGGKNKSVGIILALVVVLGLGVWFGKALLGNTRAAVVNEEVITKAEYNARVKQIENQYEAQFAMSGGALSIKDEQIQNQIKNVAMDELVNEELFLQAAESKDISVTDAEVESEIELRKSGYADEEAFQSDLKALGMTEAELRENIKNQLTIIAYAKSVIPNADYAVTDGEIQEIYTMNFGNALATQQVEGEESSIPTVEEFATANRDQFELQKLSMAAGPLVEELRSAATVEILLDLPEQQTGTTPETQNEGTPEDTDVEPSVEETQSSSDVEEPALESTSAEE